MTPTKLKFLYRSTCTSCRKARALLEKLGAQLDERELTKQPLSRDELDRLIPRSGPITDYLNPRSKLYRDLKLGQNPPTRQKAIDLILKDPNLLRRPVVIRGSKKVWGLDPEALKEFAT